MKSTRYLSIITCMALAAATASGCGSSNSNSTSNSTSGSSGSPPTKAQATSAANAINLTSADMPGFTSQANPVTAQDQQASAQLASCTGGTPPSKDVYKANSPTFSSGSGTQAQQVSSDVSVLQSASQTSQDLAAATSAKGQSCVENYLNKLLSAKSSGQGVTFGKATVTQFTPPGSSGNGFGYHFKVVATAQGITIPFYIDLLGYRSGPIETGLTTLSLSRPFPASTTSQLYSKLVSRTNQQHL